MPTYFSLYASLVQLSFKFKKYKRALEMKESSDENGPIMVKIENNVTKT